MTDKKELRLLSGIQSKLGVGLEHIFYSLGTDKEDESESNVVCLLNVGNESGANDVAIVSQLLQRPLVVKLGASFSFVQCDSHESAVKVLGALKCFKLSVDLPGNREASKTRQIVARLAKKIPSEFLEPKTIVLPEHILAAVPGLHIVNDFISEEEERALLEGMQNHPWFNVAERQVQHHGFTFDYTSNHINFDCPTSPLPEWCKFLIDRMDKEIRRLSQMHPLDFSYKGFNQLTLNRYPPGSGISPHVDTHTRFDSPITSVSLQSPVQMEFRTLYRSSDEKTPMPTHRTVHILLQPRSVCFMAGESRFAWEHAIRTRRVDVVNGLRVDRGLRVSLTFRGVRIRSEDCVCDCGWDSVCDAKMLGGAIPDRLKTGTGEGLGVNRHGKRIS